MTTGPAPYYQDELVQVHLGDCLDILPELPDNSVDAVCTDPPYALNFMGRTWDQFTGEAIDPAFMHWFAGFVDGEGCFFVHRKPQNTFDCQFAISLRADDRPILERIHRTLRMGTLSKPAAHRTGPDNPKARFSVSSKRDCLRLRDLLRAFPLRAKKAVDFELWSDALDAWLKHEPGEWDDMELLRDELMQGRAYKEEGIRVDPFQMWCWRWARECLRILKPGGHLLAFGGTRTSHRLACAVEDAGFEIRDSIAWLYGSGFPKSLNVGRAIDGMFCREAGTHSDDPEHVCPFTPQGDEWRGFGTALKPAHEPIVVARKPLSGTVAANVLRWGTGALNIDAGRIGTSKSVPASPSPGGQKGIYRGFGMTPTDGSGFDPNVGRWPANVALDESQAAALDQMSGELTSGGYPPEGGQRSHVATYGEPNERGEARFGGSSGGASRFFYTSKASTGERITYHRQSCECEDAWPTTNSPLRDTAGTPPPASSSMSRSGSLPTGSPSPTDTRSTTSTETRSTTTPATSSHSPQPTTNGSTRGASSETASGGSLAASAVSSSPSGSLTGTSVSRDGPSMGDADRATSRGWSQTSVCGECGAPSRREAHATVKPLSLMRWLVRLVTPPGGTILEPFAGSGTTVEAALLEGFHCIAIEREADYLPLITQRINRRRDPIAYLTAAGEDLGLFGDDDEAPSQPGRWPANVVLDRSRELARWLGRV